MYNAEGVRSHYNAYGEKEWARLERSLHGRVEYETTMHILRRHLPPTGRILDAGCGPGRYSIALARLGYMVTPLDISDEQLRIAAEKFREAGVTTENLIQGDVCDLHGIPDESYDAVLCLGGAVSYVREKAGEAIKELARVAKQGAPVIVSVMSLLGTFHSISTYDDAGFLTRIRDHCEWDPATPFPEVLHSKGTENWHAPMTLYSSTGLRDLMEKNECTVTEMASTNTITSSYFQGLEKITANPVAVEMLLHLEREFCIKPGLVDMGDHLIAAARASKRR